MIILQVIAAEGEQKVKGLAMTRLYTSCVFPNDHASQIKIWSILSTLVCNISLLFVWWNIWATMHQASRALKEAASVIQQSPQALQVLESWNWMYGWMGSYPFLRLFWPLNNNDDEDALFSKITMFFFFQLRYLQTLNSISAEHNSTIIFPMPIGSQTLR